MARGNGASDPMDTHPHLLRQLYARRVEPCSNKAGGRRATLLEHLRPALVILSLQLGARCTEHQTPRRRALAPVVQGSTLPAPYPIGRPRCEYNNKRIRVSRPSAGIRHQNLLRSFVVLQVSPGINWVVCLMSAADPYTSGQVATRWRQRMKSTSNACSQQFA
jgi:hypothetical protein